MAGSRSSPETLEEAAAAVRACRICTDLPLGPRPILRVSRTARLLIIGQAPGTKVHLTGISWNDPSGDRLRDWLGIDRELFYDESRVAVLGMAMCYPGRLPRGGDAPPRPICAPTWHPRLLPLMPQVTLTLAVGSYAIARLIGPGPMTAYVQNWRRYLPNLLPLPHPSWRTLAWERRNPWFAAELLPALKAMAAPLLA